MYNFYMQKILWGYCDSGVNSYIYKFQISYSFYFHQKRNTKYYLKKTGNNNKDGGGAAKSTDAWKLLHHLKKKIHKEQTLLTQTQGQHKLAHNTHSHTKQEEM